MTAAATRRLLGVSLAVLLVAVLAAVAVLVVRGRGDDPVTAPGSAPPAGPRGYAYTTATDLVVKLAGGTEFRQPGAYRGGALFYTRTGTFVVAAAVGTADDQVLTVVNTETRKVQHIGCSCASAAPVGGDRIAYVDTGTREAFVLDVFTGEAKPLALDLPGGRQATEVMAGGADSVLVRGQIIDPGQDAPDYGSPDVLYAVQVGRPAARKVAEHAMIVGSSAVGGTGPDGTPRFGVHVPDDDGRCNSGTYWVYDGSTGRATKPPSFVQSAPDEENAWMTVTDWWWDDAGVLNASISSHRCTDALDEEMTAPPTLWQLTGGSWTPADRTTAEAVRPVGDARLLLEHRSQQGESRLSRKDAAGVRRLADRVQQVVVAPGRPEPRSTGSPAAPPIDAALLRQAGVCKLACKISGRVEFRHPAWGPVTLVTTLARGDEKRDAAIAVLDAQRKVRWSHWGGDWYVLEPAAPATDSTGHLFLNYNPGRHNGVIILRPTAGGFEDLRTLPRPGDYSARFYGAEVLDADGDGRYEVETTANDCNPSCAEGTVRRAVQRWNGTDYAE